MDDYETVSSAGWREGSLIAFSKSRKFDDKLDRVKGVLSSDLKPSFVIRNERSFIKTVEV